MQVIGVASQAQHGKDTLANFLCETLNKREGFSYWKRVGFADEVKRVYCETFGVSRDFVEEWKVKNENPPGFDLPVRQGLQFIGDGFRKIRNTIWIDLAFKSRIPKIISDVRYPNEFERVKWESGLNILMGRSNKVNDDPNSSEALIKPYVVWALENLSDGVTVLTPANLSGAPMGMECFSLFVKNDGTLDELYENITQCVVPFVEQFDFGEENALYKTNR